VFKQGLSLERKHLRAFDRYLYRRLGGLADIFMTESYKDILRKAYPELYPKLVLARNMFYGIVSSVGIIVALLFLTSKIIQLGYAIKVIIITVALIGVWSFIYSMPFMRVSARAKAINRELPYAINFMAALASADVPIGRIFGALAKQREILPEMAKEAALIYRDMEVFEYDLMTAISNAISRSASSKLQDFLQGIATVVYTGGSLKNYFMSKAEQYLFELRQEQRKDLEALSVIIESFIVVGVAAPIFMIIIFTVMGWITASPTQARVTYLMIKLIMFLILPVIHAIYAYLCYDAVRRK